MVVKTKLAKMIQIIL